MSRSQGALENYKNLREEPGDHGIGRSRGGLSTKIHHLVDGRGLPLVVLVGPGQAGDSPMFPVLMDQLRVERVGPGRPRTRPEAVRGDKAYSSRANRGHLRERGIKAVIPEPSDQIGHRKRRSSAGGRPQASTPTTTAAATSSNADSAKPSNGEASPPATTNSPPSTEAEPSSASSHNASTG